MTSTLARPQLDGENPWPGLESFEESERAFFFGRDREAEALLHRVLDAAVTVLYGRSGLGKTSLLRAGLFPLLREQRLLPEKRFLPVYVRFEVKSDAQPLAGQLHRSVCDAIRAELPDAVLPSDDESLWEYLHRRDIELRSADDDRLTPVIVLDQFEELFTLGERAPALVEAFRNDFGDLAENRIPADLAARIEADEAVSARFDLRSCNYKLLVSLREDFLADLEGWCRLIPALGRSRMRLLPLNRDEAFDAVHEPAKDLMTAALAKRVVDIVAGENLHREGEAAVIDAEGNGNGHAASYLEPALLSLFCHELNEERKRRGQERFEEQLVEGAKSGILSNYYAACVRDTPAVARFVEEQLITEKGFRNSFAREDAVPSILTDDQLNRLVGMRLLRIVDYHGAQRIELTHDVLTKVVREHRDRRRADEEKHALAQTSAELARERRIGRHLRRLSAVLALVCVVAIVLGMFALKARNDAANRFREVTAERLYGQSLLMQAGLSDEGSNDTDIMQRVLAAGAITPDSDRKYELFTVLEAERDLLKIVNPVDMPSDFSSSAMTPDGTRIAAADTTGTIRVWDAGTGALVGPAMRGDEGWVSTMALSPDGSRIASGSGGGSARVWDVGTGRPVGPPLRVGEGFVSCVASSLDGTLIAAGDGTGTIRIWEAGTGRAVGPPLRGHDDLVVSVAFSPDSSRLASGGVDKTVRLWDVATLRDVGVLRGHDDSVSSVAFSPDGSRLASGGSDNTVRLWDVATLRDVGVLRGHENSVGRVGFSSDGSRVVSFSSDKSVRVWDARTWQPMLGHEGTVTSARFSDDGRRIVSGSSDKTVRVWDAATGRTLGPPLRLPDSGVSSVYPVGENRLLSTEGANEAPILRLWDARSLKAIGEPVRVPPNYFFFFIEKPDRIAVRTEPRAIQMFATDTMGPIGAVIRPESENSYLAISPEGRIVATASTDSDGTIELWDSSTGTRIGEPMKGGVQVSAVAFSHDGHTLAAGHFDSTIQLWDTDSFQPIGDPMHLPSTATVVEFSPDNQTLASGSIDGTIRLWDTDDQTLSAVLKGHESFVNNLVFSPDGTRLLSTSSDDTLRLWPTPTSTDAARDALCAKLTRNMSRDQWNDVVSEEIPYQTQCDNLPEGS